MTAMGSQITSLTVVYSTVYSDANQRKHQSFASLAFVLGNHRDRWIPRTKGQLRGNVSIWWRHHGLRLQCTNSPCTITMYGKVICKPQIIYLKHISFHWKKYQVKALLHEKKMTRRHTAVTETMSAGTSNMKPASIQSRPKTNSALRLRNYY